MTTFPLLPNCKTGYLESTTYQARYLSKNSLMRKYNNMKKIVDGWRDADASNSVSLMKVR